MLTYFLRGASAICSAGTIIPVLFMLSAIFAGEQRAVAADTLEEYTVKAALSLNFARFTEWPSDGLPINSSKISICTIGDNVIHEAFSGVEKKTIGKMAVSVINLTRIRELNRCQLLFISGMEKNKTIQLVDEIKTLPILTIGEDDEFIRSGGMVILQIVNGRVNMKINLDAVKKARLQINSRVLKLATIVSP